MVGIHFCLYDLAGAEKGRLKNEISIAVTGTRKDSCFLFFILAWLLHFNMNVKNNLKAAHGIAVRAEHERRRPGMREHALIGN